MDKFCLNWSGYDANIRSYFKALREDPMLVDVTLVTDDGQHIQAHKIILSAGSNFFNDIFLKSNHSKMLVYLKGINSYMIEPIIDFIYNGEAIIPQEELKYFIETGKDLQVKGLDSDLTGIRETHTNLLDSVQENNDLDNDEDEEANASSAKSIVADIDQEDLKLKTNNEHHCKMNEIIPKKEQDKGLNEIQITGNDIELKGAGNENENPTTPQDSKYRSVDYIHEQIYSATNDILVERNEGNQQLNINGEHSLQIDDVIEKTKGSWRCKICGKISNLKQHIQSHAERHKEGDSHVCQICRKTFLNKPTLSNHLRSIHTELYSCDICGKTGMNRKRYDYHNKQSKHNLTNVCAQ